jgi:uncharacterized protein (DUF2141 family)
MFNSILILKITLVLLLSGVTFPNAKLNVIIKNVVVGKGSVVVEVYDSKENFSRKKWLISKTLKATAESLEFSIDLSEGVYSVKVFQDLNNNGRCDEGWFHIPKEPYGLGNNFRPKFSAPRFDECKFTVIGPTIQTIELKK